MYSIRHPLENCHKLCHRRLWKEFDLESDGTKLNFFLQATATHLIISNQNQVHRNILNRIIKNNTQLRNRF